jgi:hypothetical protein
MPCGGGSTGSPCPVGQFPLAALPSCRPPRGRPSCRVPFPRDPTNVAPALRFYKGKEMVLQTAGFVLSGRFRSTPVPIAHREERRKDLGPARAGSGPETSVPPPLPGRGGGRRRGLGRTSYSFPWWPRCMATRESTAGRQPTAPRPNWNPRHPPKRAPRGSGVRTAHARSMFEHADGQLSPSDDTADPRTAAPRAPRARRRPDLDLSCPSPYSFGSASS